MALIELMTESLADSKKANASPRVRREASAKQAAPAPAPPAVPVATETEPVSTESPWDAKTVAQVWFDSEKAAEAAGFVKAGRL